MQKNEEVRGIYVVTTKRMWGEQTVSLYYASAQGYLSFSVVATKIDLRGGGSSSLGSFVEGSRMGIGVRLIPYAEDEVSGSLNEQLKRKDPSLIAKGTSLIVGLFRKRTSAMACFNEIDLESADPRFKDETLGILSAIKNEAPHPLYTVCTIPEFDLAKAIERKVLKASGV